MTDTEASDSRASEETFDDEASRAPHITQAPNPTKKVEVEMSDANPNPVLAEDASKVPPRNMDDGSLAPMQEEMSGAPVLPAKTSTKVTFTSLSPKTANSKKMRLQMLTYDAYDWLKGIGLQDYMEPMVDMLNVGDAADMMKLRDSDLIQIGMSPDEIERFFQKVDKESDDCPTPFVPHVADESWKVEGNKPPWAMFDEVLLAERNSIRERGWIRGIYGRLGEPFSLAISGGGVRAAAFASGVLWRLALEKKIKEMEYLVAVSGGGYIASAFTSFIIQGNKPKRNSDLDTWYLDRTTDTILKMQANISYLVRDLHVPEADIDKKKVANKETVFQLFTSACPRFMDLPILIFVLLFTILTPASLFFCTILIPLAEICNILCGHMGRAIFCAPHDLSSWGIFWDQVVIQASVYLLAICAGLFLLLYLVWKLAGLYKIDKIKSVSDKPRGRIWWLIGHSTGAALSRTVVAIFVLLAISILQTELQLAAFNGPGTGKSRLKMCTKYIQQQQTKAGARPFCEDLDRHYRPWFNKNDYQNLTEDKFTRKKAQSGGFFIGAWHAAQKEDTKLTPMRIIMWSILGLTILAIIIAPLFPDLLRTMAIIVGPVLLLLFTTQVIKWRIFGPITEQQLMPGILKFEHKQFDNILLVILIINIALTPFQNFLKAQLHRYYMRSLKLAFFAGGEDCQFSQVSANMFAPFLILTGTLNDWRRIDDESERIIHEIAYTPLHSGSDSVGWIPQVWPQSLAKVSALSGAATDAFILGMLRRKRYRFWLECLNLTMGDFVPFRIRERPASSPGVSSTKLLQLWEKIVNSGVSLEIPAWVLTICIYGALILAAFVDEGTSWDNYESRCKVQTRTGYTILVAITLIVVASFYTFCPYLRWLLYSPGIRQLHMITLYQNRDVHPPCRVYVTDGGVQDCTGIYQLVRRRAKRILLVIGAEDPTDNLTALRKAIQIIIDDKLATFYDLRDPSRNYLSVLDEYKDDKCITTIRLGIRFGWIHDAENSFDGHGILIAVKCRLPPGLEDRFARPLLTRTEITDKAQGRWNECGELLLREEQLGSCCCDCCHRTCNFCAPFPNVSNPNQCMTPQMFNALCRLGYCVSEEAVNEISQRLDRHEEREEKFETEML